MKEDPDMINRLLSILPALVFVLHAQAVQAQAPSQPQSQSKPQQQSQGGFLYKSTMPDGRMVYGEVPEKGAVKVEKTRPDTSNKGITTATPKEMEAARKSQAERAADGASGAGAVIQAPGARSANEYTTAELQELQRKMEAEREKLKEPTRQKQYDQAMDAVRKELDRRSSGR